jgi:hypothetical protein
VDQEELRQPDEYEPEGRLRLAMASFPVYDHVKKALNPE